MLWKTYATLQLCVTQSNNAVLTIKYATLTDKPSAPLFVKKRWENTSTKHTGWGAACIQQGTWQ